ncbi:hypothetical protein [Pseudomonas sp.]|uniref:hypothetical protein n=1 Tax=Pseudomonas sp. TaxID=306 RepID=UPI0027BA60F6|nr:hypothetical protein [Pseudomonas sp.]
MSDTTYHVAYWWNRREKADGPLLTDMRRTLVNWPTPIEYESDLTDIEDELKAALQDEQLLKPDSNSNHLVENHVKIVTWQKLLGADRPGK